MIKVEKVMALKLNEFKLLGSRIRTRINLEAKEWVKFEEGR